MTMYKAMVYYLRFLLLAAILLAAFRILNYSPLDIAIEAVYLAAVCYFSNRLIAKVFKTQGNDDSAAITSHILALIVGPAAFLENWAFFTVVAVLAMLSKYVLAIRKRHIFNPAAFAVVLSAVLMKQGASWWVGSAPLLPFVVIGGIWLIRKIHREHLVLSFLLTYFLLALVVYPVSSVGQLLIRSAIVFFSCVMLVEPITSPAGRKARIYFGALVAAVLVLLQRFAPQIPYTLELSLLAGNVFAFFTKPQGRLALRLNQKISEAANTMTLLFEKPANFSFAPGQYLEWVLHHPHTDSRGIKRYFTIASSPTEKDLQISTRLAPERSSSFKLALKAMQSGDEISASELDGDFVLPQDPKIPLVFIAGGIGITPFRSMIKYLLDKNEKRDMVLLYSNKSEAQVAFKELFEKAKRVGLKTVYVITEQDGYIDPGLIKKEIPDWAARTFYVSGPEPMVEAFEKMLMDEMGIKGGMIKRDYFPGYTDTHMEK